MQMRPRALLRVLTNREHSFRAAMRWYYRIGRRVWPYEIWNFLFRDRHEATGPTLRAFWGAPQHHEQQAMSLTPSLPAASPIRPTAYSTFMPITYTVYTGQQLTAS